VNEVRNIKIFIYIFVFLNLFNRIIG
jgi:hypothetical protein